MSSLGNNIRRARIAKGLSQEDLASKLGVSKAAICRYEQGAREPSIRKLNKIAEILGVTLGYLEGFERIDSKKFFNAIKSGDIRSLEKLMDLPEGSMFSFTPDESKEIVDRAEEKRQTTEIIANKLQLYLKTRYDALTEQDYLSIKNLIDIYSQLNPEGQSKAVERVEELTEIPKYKKEPPQD